MNSLLVDTSIVTVPETCIIMFAYNRYVLFSFINGVLLLFNECVN